MLSLRVLKDPISELSWCLTRRRVWWDSFDSIWNESMPSCFKQEPHASWAWGSWVWELPFRALYLHSVFLCHGGFPRASLRPEPIASHGVRQRHKTASTALVRASGWVAMFPCCPSCCCALPKGTFHGFSKQGAADTRHAHYSTEPDAVQQQNPNKTLLVPALLVSEPVGCFWWSFKPRVQAEPHRASKTALACPGHFTSCSVFC